MSMLKTAFSSRSVEPFYTGGKVSLANDGNTLATTFNEDVIITDLSTGEQLHKIEGDGSLVTTLEISPDGQYVCICSQSLQLRIYDLSQNNNCKLLKKVKAHESPILVMTIDPTSSLVATGGAEGAVKVWDIKGGYVTHNFRGHGGIISALKFWNSGTQWKLASGSDDYKVRVWDLVKSKCLFTLDSHVSIIRGLDWNEDGTVLISGGRDKIVSIWDTTKGKLKATLPVLESVETVGLFNGFIYTGGESGEVKLWNIQQASLEKQSNHRLIETTEEVSVLDIMKNNDKLFTILTDQTILILDSDLNVERRIAGTHGEIIDLCYLEDDKLAIATNSPEVRIINTKNMLDCQVLSGHKDIVIAIDRSVDGQWLVTAGKDKIAKLWHLEQNEFKEYQTFRGHAGAIGAVALPKGPPTEKIPKFVVTGSQDLTVKLWNVKTGQAVYTRKAHDKDINAIDVSPDDRWFATASQDRNVKIWDVDSGESIGMLKGHRRGVWTVKFNHFDKLIATGSGDKTVKIWNLNDYQCNKTMEGHANSVLKVGWISNGTQLASTSGDGLVKIWDVKTGECNCTLDNHEDKVWSLATKDDDKGFASGGGDSVITIWTDVTEQVQKENDEKEAKQVEQEQELDNLVREGRWKEAVLLALELDHPYRLLKVCEKVGDDMNQVVEEMDMQQINKLLSRVKDWNTTAKTSYTAQRVLNAVLVTKSVDEMVKLKGVVKLIEAILPYSERHYKRVDELLEQSYTLDYLLNEMNILQ